MLKLTRNDYKKYVKERANKLYTVAGYTIEDYKRELDAVRILPLDLKRFNLGPETERWLNAFFDEEDEDRNGNYMLRGFTRIEETEMEKLGLSYGDYTNAYSFYAYSDKERLIYTYCEGDTTLTLFETAEAYIKVKQEIHDWYKEQYE